MLQKAPLGNDTRYSVGIDFSDAAVNRDETLHTIIGTKGRKKLRALLLPLVTWRDPDRERFTGERAVVSSDKEKASLLHV